jgi:hypothetical protein
MGQVLRFPSNRIARTSFTYLWSHELDSREYQGLNCEARLVYLTLCRLADETTQQTRPVGLSLVGKLSGIHRANARRAILAIEEAGLVRVERSYSETADGRRRYGRSQYQLLTPASAVVSLPGEQLSLPFARLRYSDFKRATIP